MAISTNYEEVKAKYNSRFWDSIDEFEEYYLRELSEKLADRNYYTDRNGVQREIDAINYHPKLKEYEVWMSGYAVTGESAGAHLVGKTKARNFAQACHILMCEQKLEYIKEQNNPDYKEYCTPGRWDYDPVKLSCWNCKLYWSEKLARKSFG